MHHVQREQSSGRGQEGKPRSRETAQEIPDRSRVVPRVRLIGSRVGTHPQREHSPHTYKCRKSGEFSAQSESSGGASRPTPLHSVDGGHEKTSLLTTIPPKFLSGQPVALMHNEMKSDNSSNDDSVLRQAILKYLEEHPDAIDAVAGIAEWWIARSQIRVEVEALRRVLKELTESGVLKEMRVTGETYYRLARRDVN